MRNGCHRCLKDKKQMVHALMMGWRVMDSGHGSALKETVQTQLWETSSLCLLALYVKVLMARLSFGASMEGGEEWLGVQERQGCVVCYGIFMDALDGEREAGRSGTRCYGA